LKVSLDKKECDVTFKENKTNAIKLVEAFNKLGYTAKIKKDSTNKEQETEKTEHRSHDGQHNDMND
jgi:cation transport ATPase